jgi:hypothetical protein
MKRPSGLWTILALVLALVVAPAVAGAQVAPPGDRDGDGVLDGVDNCPAIPNLDQADANGDRIGDACQGLDDDRDGVNDGFDNCPGVFNPDQADFDRDTFGDACDADDDNDGVADAQDNCPIVANTDQADDDRDGLGNACDATFNAGTLVDLIEENSSGAITVLRAVNPPGVNGLIAKLSGAGGVPKKVADTVTAFLRGAIDVTAYGERLTAALEQLGGYEAQIRAKMGIPPDDSIPAAEGALLLQLSNSTRDAINALMGAPPDDQ